MGAAAAATLRAEAGALSGGGTGGFDLAAYLERVRLPAAPEPDADGLAAIQRAHRLAIPYENLDVILGRGIAIDSAAVFDKLVTRRRGGYCFEHGRLLLDALAALGFAARPLLARVRLGQPADVPPLTHTLALVDVRGEPWIADAGFGGSYAPPMPLADGAEADAPDGARFRLERDGEGWLLRRNGHPDATDGRGTGPGWQDQYGFATTRVFDADLDVSNHWASTAPASRFVQRRIVSIPLPRGFASLDGRAYRRHVAGATTAAEIADPRVYRLRLSLMFGIDLAMEEVMALGLFA